MRNLLIFLVTIVVCTAPTVVSAQLSNDSLSAFLQYKTIPVLELVTPTVIEVPLENNLYRSRDVLVYEVSTQKFIGSYLIREQIAEAIRFSAITEPPVPNSSRLVDNDLTETVRFEVPGDFAGSASITLVSSRPIAATSLILALAEHVTLPLTVSVQAKTDTGLKTVVATKKMTSSVVTFPEVTAQEWLVTFTYAQPLAITELTLKADDENSWFKNSVRFLAQPGENYQLYINPDRSVRTAVSEAGNLTNDTNVVKVDASPSFNNPHYTPSDIDGDGVPDSIDNCVNVPNLDQIDIDNNGLGDTCDDFDRDGILNPQDNCPNLPNRDQADEDGDGIGDVCDDAESRFTEQHSWIPWLGMGVATAILIFLFVLVATTKRPEEEGTEITHEPE